MSNRLGLLEELAREALVRLCSVAMAAAAVDGLRGRLVIAGELKHELVEVLPATSTLISERAAGNDRTELPSQAPRVTEIEFLAEEAVVEPVTSRW